MRKKYCDYYFSIRHVETVSRNSHTPLKLYAWFIRNDKGEILQSSIDDDCEFDKLYDSKIQAELAAREAIQDHY